MKSRQRLSLDKTNTLPENVIENILCLVPIKEAARTSILSREWRYKWTKIPKLDFEEYMFEVSTDIPSSRKKKTRRRKLFHAIKQVLLVHEGSITEFSLYMQTDNTCVKIDRIIKLLSRNTTVKKFTLDLASSHDYSLPLSVFSLCHLTDLCLIKCDIYLQPPFNEISSLTSLYLEHVTIPKNSLFHILSSSSLLKNFTLMTETINIHGDDNSTIIHLFKSLPVIEHLSLWSWIIPRFVQDVVPRELPVSLVCLKYVYLEEMCFIDGYGLPFLVLLMRCSPNLEKIKLKMLPDSEGFYDHDKIDCFERDDYSDIWLEHINELEIEDFNGLKPELEFGKLILAKSPVLKKMKIFFYYEVAINEEMKMLKTLISCPRASSVAKLIVKL